MKTKFEKNTTKSILAHRGYLLGDTIGEGAFAKIKIADSKLTNQKVAVKMLSKKNCESTKINDKKYLMMKREVNTVKGLNHPNIVKYFEAIETTTRVCIVMEYMKNGCLLDLLRDEGYLSEAKAQKWYKQILEALTYIHERGITHRDIKCENIMLDDTKENIKLIDFGLAKNMLQNFDKQIVKSSTFCGTYAYASLEILTNVPHRPDMSDLWASSVVFYAMLFGQLPFCDDNLQLEIQDIEHGVPFPLKPKVSEGCKKLLMRIFVPIERRMTLGEVKADRWMQTFNAKK